MIHPREWHCMAEVSELYDTIILAIGAKYHSGFADTTEMYSVKHNKWKLGPKMGTKRTDSTCVTENETIYVMGGWLLDMISIEKLDSKPQTPRWEKIDLSVFNHYPQSGIGSFYVKPHSILLFGG